MVRAKGTTLKAMQFKMKQEGAITNNGGAGGGESSSFRLQLYYGDASAGSVPFMWESHPGTPKHPTTEYSSLPPLTPPPAFNQTDYNNSTSLRTLFLAASSGKTNVSAASPSSKMSTSLRSLFLDSGSRRGHVAVTTSPPSYTSLSCSLSSTPMNKGQGENEFIRRRSGGVKVGMEDDDGDEKRVGGGLLTSTLCFGGGFMKVYRMKKVKNALMSIGRHGKTNKIN